MKGNNDDELAELAEFVISKIKDGVKVRGKIFYKYRFLLLLKSLKSHKMR